MRRRTAKALAIAATIATTYWASISEASLLSLLPAPNFQFDRINFGAPTLAPMAHAAFCLRYRDDCKAYGIDFRRRSIALTVERMNELNRINRKINREIAPKQNVGSVATEKWLLSPPAGDCKDYAVTKRHELLARGWPSRALLLAEVVIASGEHHLVVLVRMKDTDLVLDNLNGDVQPVALTNFHWVRVESPRNPRLWLTVGGPNQLHTASN